MIRNRVPVFLRAPADTQSARIAGLVLLSMLLLFFSSGSFSANAAISEKPGGSPAFSTGVTAYSSGNFKTAAGEFRQSVSEQLASGSLQNLGSSEWQLGSPGPAILAWERSLWIDPFNQAVRGDLRFARKAAQLDAPELAWYEVVSTWLPPNWWAWIAGISFWGAIAAILLPGIFRWRRAPWQQVIAAFGLTVFLLSLPAHAGIYSRSRLGFFVQDKCPLRLTPTLEAQVQSRVPAGEPARCIRRREGYLLVQTPQGRGWVLTNEFAFVCNYVAP